VTPEQQRDLKEMFDGINADMDTYLRLKRKMQARGMGPKEVMAELDRIGFTGKEKEPFKVPDEYK